MTVYILLLLITAFIAYFFGSMRTMVLASNFVFRKNLLRLGSGNSLVSNFRRIYGWKGIAKLLLVELVRDILPILIGGWLLKIKGHADIGRIFAGFCLVMGRLFPLMYDFRGSSAAICAIAAGLFIEPAVGIAAMLVCAALIWFSRYVAVGAAAAGAVVAVITAIMVNDSLTVRLALIIGAVMVVGNLPALLRILRGKEEPLSFEDDITYKLDQKF